MNATEAERMMFILSITKCFTDCNPRPQAHIRYTQPGDPIKQSKLRSELPSIYINLKRGEGRN